MTCEECNGTGINGSGGICRCKFMGNREQLPYDQWPESVLIVRERTLAHNIPRYQTELVHVRREIQRRKKCQTS